MQSFALCKQPIKLIIIEPSRAAIDICKLRWLEVNQKSSNEMVEISFQRDYSGLSEKITLAIIATNSSQRYSALKKLLKSCKCSYIILEKFLFTVEEEYEMARSLIKNAGCKVYVNCMKRLYDCYSWTFERLSMEKGILNMKVIGNNWGMSTSSIHFVDLFCYLSNDAVKSCEFSLPDSVCIIESKRPGYIEFIGHLEVESMKGNKLKIESNEGIEDGIFIYIEKGNIDMEISEMSDTINVKIPPKLIEKEFNYPFQSQLTLKCFEKIMSERNCSLPLYEEAANSHLMFLRAVKKLMVCKKYEKEWKIT